MNAGQKSLFDRIPTKFRAIKTYGGFEGGHIIGIEIQRENGTRLEKLSPSEIAAFESMRPYREQTSFAQAGSTSEHSYVWQWGGATQTVMEGRVS